MRVLKIELKNINSLKGYWCIDFEHPDYKKNHDLFVIHGNMGTGKTSVLDAVTLALYGRTPRLAKVGNGVDGNELMTRNTGSCMARVTYSCGEGIYVSTFSQLRADEKPSGKLKQPECSITDRDGNVFFSGNVNDLNEWTKKIIKLDYDQFCRSIMLAQGEFDKFIRCEGKKKDELIRDRAVILSKLNGTEKYKAIGEAIGSKISEIEKKFKAAKENLETSFTDIPDETQRQKLQDEKEKLEIAVKKNEEKLESVINKIVWLEKLEEKQSALQLAEKNLKDAEQNQKDFSEKNEILEKAEKAKNCETLYVALNTIETNIKQNQEKKAQLEIQIPVLEETYCGLREEENALKKQVEEQEKYIKSASELWNDVNDLDKSISYKKTEIESQKKRVETAKNNYESCHEEIKKLQEENVISEKDISLLIEYLKENEKDKILAENLNLLKEKKKSLVESSQLILNLQDKESEKEQNLANLKNKKEELEKEVAENSREMENFVSREFQSITDILRKGLKPNTPCPVCGSKEHYFSEKKDEVCEGAASVKENEVVEQASDITTRLEESKEKLQKCEISLLEVDSDLRNIKDQRKQKENENSAVITELDKFLEPWNINCKNLDFVEVLTAKSQLYEAKKIDLDKKTSLLEQNKHSLQEKEGEIQSLENIYEEEKRVQKEKESALAVDSKKRFELFGNKIVEDEKKTEETKLEQSRKSLGEKNLTATEAKEKLTTEDTRLKALEESLKTDGERCLSAENEFEEALKKYRIADRQEFLATRLEENLYNQYSEIRDKIKKQMATTEAVKIKAEKEYESCLKENKVEESKEELENIKTQLNSEVTEWNRRGGEINRIFVEIETKLAEYENQKKAFEELEKQHEIWKQMNTFIGKLDGSDLNSYVQGIAFKNLLGFANKYLKRITGKYTLVQKGKSVDFDIYDESFDGPRPIQNASGGEKFIISLSLALGIAEMASSHIRVDSLFLDEGFGSVSGEPLTEAINSLKSLQSSGKMIGIITHIDKVINEFDQRLEVKSVPGGYSEIHGSGVYNTETRF